MLINFGGPKLYIKIYPNNLSQRKVLNTNFDINKINLAEEDKKLIRPFLEISQEILEILGPGYFHQVYRRSFWDELNINNIEFIGELKRTKINKVLNKSKFGIVASNRQDGCPRVITEILTSGTPLFIKSETRLLDYYKNHGVIKFDNNNFVDKIKKGFQDYKELKKDLQKCFSAKSEKITRKSWPLINILRRFVINKLIRNDFVFTANFPRYLLVCKINYFLSICVLPFFHTPL